MRAPPRRRGRKNKKYHHRPANSALVVTADHAGMQPQQGPSGNFYELIESPCTNHDYPIKHLYKDCQLLKHLLRRAGRPKDEKGKEAATKKGGIVGKDLMTEG